jgi:hypothetical protein
VQQLKCIATSVLDYLNLRRKHAFATSSNCEVLKSIAKYRFPYCIRACDWTVAIESMHVFEIG